MPPLHFRPPALRARRSLVLALLASLLLHAAWSLWPADVDSTPPEPPLRVALTQMPAPPRAAPQLAPLQPAAVAPAHLPPRPRRRALAEPAPTPATPVIATAEPAPASVEAAASGNGAAPGEAASRAPGAASEGTRTAGAAIGPRADATPAGPQLPPRLDLAYKVFLGTQGFLIGDATYRFEHDGDDYRISTVAQARGLAALFVHGRGVVESRGRITATGLKPAVFTIERGNADKREVARFDWERNVVTLHDAKDEPLSPLTFDPLTVLWQTYFTPPESDVYRFSVATTRKVYHYTVTREGTDTIAWRGGSVLAQRWHRVNEENRTEAWFWLAPSMHYIPVKIRVTATRRGTVEALLDGMRSDSDPEVAATEPPLEARTVTQQDPFAPRGQ